LMR
jgi:hypothetical protein